MSTPKKPKAPAAPITKPIGGLYDRDPVTGANRFVYVRSEHSNIKTTFDRVRRELAEGRRKL